MKLFKQLDKLVSKSFVGPYLVSFLVAEFVLVLQFIWRYIDEFIGRGVSVTVIMEMIFYYGVTIIPLAVPISILISSVMVYGNLAEKYELTSFKSAGVSLFRIMRPGITIAILTALFSIFSANVLKPKANLSFYQTFDNVRRAKPTMTIDQGIFNYDFKGYAIRVGKKHADGKGIEDVLIYDQTDRRLLGLISAKEGDMYISENGQFFTMELRDGVQYQEMERKSKKGRRDQDQFVRVYFDKFVKHFDMSAFEFSMASTNTGRRKHDLYNSFQMQAAIDSIDRTVKENIKRNRSYYSGIIPGGKEIDVLKEQESKKLTEKYSKEKIAEDQKNLNNRKSPYIDIAKKDGVKPKTKNKNKNITKRKKGKKEKVFNKSKHKKNKGKASNSSRYYKNRVDFRIKEYEIDTIKSLMGTIKRDQLKTVLFRAKSSSQTVKEKYRNLTTSIGNSIYSRNRFELRMHQQLCWAMICIIFMFIGAPLGSIVRKGGFGYPLLVAIVFFVIFIFTNILGEKLMNNGTILPILGAWLPVVILLPFAIYFTFKAVRDSRFNFNIRSWIGL